MKAEQRGKIITTGKRNTTMKARNRKNQQWKPSRKKKLQL